MTREEPAGVRVIDMENPLSWTFPAGLMLLAGTLICLVTFMLYPRSAPPECELRLRVVMVFAIPGALGGLLLPLSTRIQSTLLRGLLGLVAGVVCGAISWLVVASLFPSFC
jgi:hypothetical protein